MKKPNKICVLLIWLIAGFIFLTPQKVKASQDTIQYGANIQASISFAGEKDTFLFNGSANDVISLMLNRHGGNSNFIPRMELYRPDGTVMRAGQGDYYNGALRLDSLRLPVSGLYILRVLDDNNNEAGSYTLGLHLFYPPTGKLISYGTVFQDTIPTYASVRNYTFNGSANDVISLMLNRHGGNSNFIPRMELYRPDGTPMRVAQCDYYNGALRMDSLRLPVSGLYILRVLDDNNNEAGSYTLGLHLFYPPTGKLISYGTVFQDTIPTYASVRNYTFNGSANDVISLMLNRHGGNSYFLPRIEFYRPDGTTIWAGQGDYYNGALRLDSLRLPVSGLYILRVLDDNNNEAGFYTLGLHLFYPPTGRLISYGAVLQDTISTYASVRNYTFNGSANDVISLMLNRHGGNSNFIPRIEFYRPDGTAIWAGQGDYYNGALRIDFLRLPASGLYILRVLDDNNNEAGFYTLGLHLFYPPTGRLISYGAVFQDTIPTYALVRNYTFNGSANDVISLMLNRHGGNSNFIPRMELYRPDGTTIWAGQGDYYNGALRLDSLRLPVSGLYILRVLDDNNNEAGSYTLGLHLFYPPTGKLISYGTVFQDTIPTYASVRNYTFNGSANDVISLLLNRHGGNSNFAPRIEFYRPDGTAIWAGQGDYYNGALRMDSLRLPVSGLYILRVLDDNNNEAGSYTLGLHLFYPPTGRLISYGTVFQDTIPTYASVRNYTFNGSANDVISLMLNRHGGNSNFIPRIELYRPDGTPMRAGQGDYYNGALRLDTLRLPASGLYILRVLDDNNNEAGSYTLSLSGFNSLNNLNDVGIDRFITPQSGCGLTNNETIKVKIKNYGNRSAAGFNVGYKINNGATITENVGVLTILPDSTKEYNFAAKANFSAPGNYTIKVFTSLPEDSVRNNDTLTGTITTSPGVTKALLFAPANNTTAIPVTNIDFSWSAASNATYYDFYLWKKNEPQPSSPVAVNLTTTHFIYSGSLSDTTIYNWKVISRNLCSNMSSDTFQILIRKYPDLTVQDITAGQTNIAPNDSITLSWNVANIGTASSFVNWTERIYMQSPSGQNRTLLKQSVFTTNAVLDTGHTVLRSDKVRIPAQFNIGDQGVFVVQLIPGSAIEESPGSEANNTGVQQTPWTVRKLLTLGLSGAQVTEGSPAGITATVNRTGSLADSLIININLRHSERFSFPSVITIPAGQAGSVFSIVAPDNSAIEGTVTDTLSAAATGFQPAKASFALLDNDKPSLSIVNLPANAMEGQTITFRVTTNLPPAAPLQVFLTSNNQTRFPVPSSVTIPVGTLSAAVTVRLEQDNIPEIDLDVSITAGASNHNPAAAIVELKDDDLPGLELVVQTNTISEGAGAFATQATLRRASMSNPVAFTVNLSADISNALILPGAISLAAGEMAKTFTIGAVDNSLADGQRPVTITASIFVASCGCSAPPASSGSVSVMLTVSDNDGPSLQLSAAQLTLPEGSANAGSLRVTRNTPTTKPLSVSLSSSDTTEATIPATALIPAGQTFVDVPITTVNDGITDGSQQVYFGATADGFSPGSVWVIVTDLNKPDLQIPTVKLNNADVQAMTLFTYQVGVKNTGTATAPAGVILRGYLSSDNMIDSKDSIISEDKLSKAVAVGETVQVLNAIKAPDLPGSYKLLFQINADLSLSELLYTNNTSTPVRLTIKPDYTATAKVDPLYFTKGTTVTITGEAQKSNGTPAGNSSVEVYVITNGLRRKIMATTDNAGHYNAQFVPLANEAGHYTVGAGFPNTGDTTAQDAFDILGVRVNGGSIPQFRVILNDTLKGSLTIQNLSNTRLADFSLAPVSLPGGAKMYFETAPVIAGNASISLGYTITGSALSPGNNFEVASLKAIAKEGIIQTTDVYYYCQAASAYVVADITKINVTTSQARERLVEFRLVNRGLGATGVVNINLPQVGWISSVTPKALPSITTGDTAVVILRFQATADVPFNYPVTGTLGVSTQNGNSFNLPFTFEKVSDTTGTVKVTATDQFTYYTEGGPKVQGAHVQIKNYFSGLVYADGYTDANGLFIATGVPEGRHRIVIDKEKHLSHNSTVTIDPGDTTEVIAFLNYQAITFNWSVVPTAIQDQYDITLTTVFETNVPKPVVTIDMPKTMPQLSGNDVYAFSVTLTNHGLIAAKDVALNLPANDPEYEFVTNYVPADLLAGQSIQVPVVMRRRTGQLTSGTYGFTSVGAISQFLGITPETSSNSSQDQDCRKFGFISVVYWYICNLSTGLWERTGAVFSFEGSVCPGAVPDIPCSDCGIGDVTGSDNIFPVCASCPPPVCFGCEGKYEPPVYKEEKTSCLQCINAIIGAVAGCIPGKPAEIISTVSCILGVWLEGDLTDIIDCLPSEKPLGIDCLLGIIDAIETCLKTKVANNNGGPPLGAVLQEIANNFQIVFNAYTAKEDWGKEYFGNMIFSNSWNYLAPQLEPYIIHLDSIRSNVQTIILSSMVGYEIQASTLQSFFTRWNTSIYARSKGVLTPNAQYPDIINWTLVKSYSDSMILATRYAINKGYKSVYDMYQQEYQSLNEIIDGQQKSVCASVSVQLSQRLTMTREAFEGTLEIFNGHPTDAMDSLSVTIRITDQNGVPSNGLFEIQTKSLTNLSDVTGTGVINARQKGLVKFLFIPETGAAPTAPRQYNFGGFVRYWDPYAKAIVTLPLSSIPLTVNPGPNLMLHYFMERNILGDDALTSPDIEPSVPAELAVMVENQGYGPVVNMTISSAQPKILDNEKGLAINFNLIGSKLQGQSKKLGVTDINFGTIPALQTRIGQWYFTSSLLGKFVSYEASVVHSNSFGNPDLSLVKGVKLHELTKSIREYGSQDDGINDFLVNDIFDVADVPDIIYFSQGIRTAKVYGATGGSFSSPVAPPSFTNTLTVTPSAAGWNYIKLADPGNRLYDLVSVTRSDGQKIPLDNAWLTFITLPVSRPPVYENKFHFVDSFVSSVPVTYTVVWKPRNLNVPKVDSITGVPLQVTATQVKNLTVVFNKRIDPATFTYEDLTLTFQGGANLINSSAVITQTDTATFNVDLSVITTGNGFYTFTVQTANVKDVYGISGLTGKQASWTQYLNVPMVESFLGIPVSKTDSAFNKIQVLFNLPVDVSTVTPARFTVTMNAVLQSGTLTIDSVRADHKLFYLSGLRNILTQNGKYFLNVDLPNIRSVNQIAGLQAQSVALTVDNTGPVILDLEKSNAGGLDPQHMQLINITFNEEVAGFNTASVQLTRNGEVLPLNIAQLSNTDLSNWTAGNFGMLTYPEGDYTFSVSLSGVKDAVGNRGSGTQQVSWTVNRSALITLSGLTTTPDLGFSNTDGITSGLSMNVAFHLSGNASQVTISQVDLSGEAPLAVVSNVAAGDVSLPVTLLAGGNTGIKVTVTGANGGIDTAEMALYIDQIPLSAQWLFAADQSITRQIDTIAIALSSRPLSNTGLLNALQFRRNGSMLPTGGFGLEAADDSTFSIFGLRGGGLLPGHYQLTLDLTALSKYSSGKAGGVPVSVSWTVLSTNRTPIANAGRDTTILAIGNVALNATASFDPDADSLTYRWSSPEGIALSDSTSPTPSFTLTSANRDNVYPFLLIVSDGTLFSTDVVEVAVAKPSGGLLVSAKAFLGGAYTASTGMMPDSLRAQSLLPLSDPYPSLGFTGTGSTLSANAGAFDSTGSKAITDWVWIELRNSANPAQVTASRSGLLRRDGSIVDMDGTSPVMFTDAPTGDYYLALRHRNHLGVMTASPVSLNTTTATSVDFTAPATATWGTDARKAQGSVMVLWPGDLNGDRRVRYNGSSNDKNIILSKAGLSTPNNVVLGYDRTDANLDGKVRYNGATNDKNVILTVVGLATPNTIVTEQIPN